jgi:pSer/pThr/pTyr-binding forkhead associated (FHA) protein
MALLIWKNEVENPRIVPLGNAVLFIGRDSSSGIYIDASEISRNHASISFVDGKYILRDNGSANGSFLNGIQTSEGVLAHGDEIRFGPYIFAVDLLQMPGTAAQQPEEPASLERRGNAYGSLMTFNELEGHEDEGEIKIESLSFSQGI